MTIAVRDDPAIEASADEAAEIAEEAYIFMYPLLLMDAYRKQMTNVVRSSEDGLRAPHGEFAHLRAYPSLAERRIPHLPFDILLSTAWLDLTAEPMIVTIPEGAGRYYFVGAHSMWAESIASLGWRTTGTAAAAVAFVPPGWSGEIPAEVDVVNSQSRHLLLALHIACSGPEEYSAVHALQDGFGITPLSRWGSGDESRPFAGDVDPTVDMKTPPHEQVEFMSARQYFEEGARLLSLHTPRDSDYSQIWRLKRLGLTTGKFSFDGLNPQTKSQMERARISSQARIATRHSRLGAAVNGWQLPVGAAGAYGIDYLQRAAAISVGAGVNQPYDVFYPLLVDDRGPGEESHTMHFAQGWTPPVNASWSISLYDHEGYTVPNQLGRAQVSSNSPLLYNEDGSLDIYIQPESPGGEWERNWLPAPVDRAWTLMMRLWAPKKAALDGTWFPPPLELTGETRPS
jgi:hypothetical protein